MQLPLIAVALATLIGPLYAQTTGDDWERSGPTCLIVPQSEGPWAAVCPPSGWAFDRSGSVALLRRAEIPVPISMQAFPHTRPSALEQELRRLRGQYPGAVAQRLPSVPLPSGDSASIWNVANHLIAFAPDTLGDLLISLDLSSSLEPSEYVVALRNLVLNLRFAMPSGIPGRAPQ